MDRVTTRRSMESLSGKSPAGRTFAEEFAEIRRLEFSVEENIEEALRGDPEFAPVLESGAVAVPTFRVALEKGEFGAIPTGTLQYRLRMPSGEETAPIQHELTICLSHAGSPIFRVNGRQFTCVTEAVLILKTAIKYMLTKE